MAKYVYKVVDVITEGDSVRGTRPGGTESEWSASSIQDDLSDFLSAWGDAGWHLSTVENAQISSDPPTYRARYTFERISGM